MTIRFDRTKPDSDQFSCRLVNAWGWPLREEHWSAKEFFRLYGLTEYGTPIPQPADEKLEKQRKMEMELRMKKMQAATQPAPAWFMAP
jgi:hypothetical protein